jgi:hypothetical protein
MLLLSACGDGGEGTPSDNNAGADDAGTDDDDAASGRDASSSCQPQTCDELERTGIEPIDTDGDGWFDCAELSAEPDPDGDGLPACADEDSDGDGIPDSVEGYDDADVDGIPNALDADADGDNILDEFDGSEDGDGDGIPNFLDTDSDGDGFTDTEEFGRQPDSGLAPVDRDADGIRDFLDLDSDGDGLADAEEVGCPAGSDRTQLDTDGDGVTDLLEVLYEADPCDSTSDLTGRVDFYFVLPFGEPPQSDELEFATSLQAGDVSMNVDTTGSMQGQINALKASLSDTIIPGLRAEIGNIAVGVSTFEDFPCNDHGSTGDTPFSLIQRVTSNPLTAQNAVNSIALGNGGDAPESGVEALYQAATGAGTDDCQPGIVTPFDPLRNYEAGFSDGTIGGAGFRPGALPMIVHITDNTTHAAGSSGYAFGASRDEALDAVRAIGGRVIGVATNATPEADLRGFASETNAVVPICAWDQNRPAGCAPGQCCTGLDGEGVAPVAGQCPLVFSVNASGDGLGQTIVDGIKALLEFAPTTVTTRLRPDAAELGRSGIDTTCFITSVVPNAGFQQQGACTGQPERTDTDGNGDFDGFAGVIPGAQLFFDVTAQNNCVPATLQPQTFFAFIDVIAGGDVVLDTQLVTILVPPDFKNER